MTLLDKHKPCWSTLGFRYENPKKAIRYFCTPKGAWIFGSLGVDGIHYCTVPGFGDTVFVVNPSAPDDRYVMPVAENIAMFFSLIHTLHGTQMIDSMIFWSRDQFDTARTEMMAEEDPQREQEWQCLCSLCPLTDVEDPYGYVHAQCEHFDPEKIPYTRSYYENLGMTSHCGKADDFVSTMIICRKK